jgi:hypothetical protein
VLSRKTLFVVTAVSACAVGAFTLLAPAVFLASVKQTVPSEAANVMARTTGVLLLALGALNFLVREHPPSPTLRAILAIDLVVQLGLLPIDPLAYAHGVYATPAAFVPNTLLHLALAAGFAHFLRQGRDRRGRASP